MNNSINVSHKSIRRVASCDRFRLKILYTTSKGINRMVSVLKNTRDEAEKEMDFRINGLKNGGKTVTFCK
jgi:hypothetical protein